MKKKERIFTFKTDAEQADILDGMENKSDFIRKAIEVALDNRCPLCNGTGALTADQHKHMQNFLTLHSLEKCEDCDAVHFTCQTTRDNALH